jgi:hypothetical protein
MWTQFFLENVHFAVNIFAALVMFAVFWLYLDTLKVRKSTYLLVRLGGFLLMSVSYMGSAVQLESSIIDVGLIPEYLPGLVIALRIAAYAFILVSLLGEPLQKRPHPSMLLGMGMGSLNIPGLPLVLLPTGAALTAYLYLRRATVGLENHIKPIALGFYILSVSEFAGLSVLYRSTPDPAAYRFVAPFGAVWLFQLITLGVAVGVIGRWVFAYLFKQFQAQLFMIFTIMILIVYLVTAIAFTGFLVASIRSESLDRLNTDVRVLSYVFDARASESVSAAQLIAGSADIIDALMREDRNQLRDLAVRSIGAKNEATLLIAGLDGRILARGENPERIGDSLSADPLVRRALGGATVSTILTQDSVLAPIIWIKAAAPVMLDGKVIGAVITGTVLDAAFVDGMRKTTGLDAVIYAGNKISASTIIDPESRSRLVGVTQENQELKETVLAKGQTFAGSVQFANRPHFGAFLPLLDIDKNAVGMLAVIRPEVSVIAAAAKSIELTFIVTVILLVVSVFPAYLVSRSLAGQMKT